MSHHTRGEIAGAFKAAAAILEEVAEIGFSLPHFELFPDGSGILWISSQKREEELLESNWQRIAGLVYSNRIKVSADGCVGIATCEGLFTYARENPRPL